MKVNFLLRRVRGVETECDNHCKAIALSRIARQGYYMLYMLL